ncbi:hypothetical protein KA005_47200 [bacterium]|nr:hypothetical protein [bacterium]
MANKILTYRKTKTGRLECSLDLSQLYDTKDQLLSFKTRFKEFIKSDPYNRHIYRLKENLLMFKSEQLIPSKGDSRPPLLLVFGNPASHSVKEGMFFSYEGTGKEHRFWKDIMTPSKILDMGFEQNQPLKERNRLRKEKILNLDYKSPYRIGFCVFVSLPSGPSGLWSGIGGVHKLLGSKAMRMLEPLERERILKIVKKFITPEGKVVTFQKNAWKGLKTDTDPVYSIKSAKTGRLVGSMNSIPEIPLLGAPPTRLIGPCRRILGRFLI